MPPIRQNTLFYGDNLDILRDYLDDDCVDLIYLDPPFNSSRSYNVLFKDESGHDAPAQITAFEDTWHWNAKTEEAFAQLVQYAGKAGEMIAALRSAIGTNQMMAYLTMMAARLVELHRVLKPTGSLYLHCDPTASHYLKVILDNIFGGENFRNDIVWKRKSGRGETNHKAIRYGVSNDSILFYAKSQATPFTGVFIPNNPDYVASKFNQVAKDGRIYHLADLGSPSPRPNLTYEYKGYKPPVNGWAVSLERMEQMEREGRLYFPEDKTKRIRRKRFLDELKGENVDSLWVDIPPINSQAAERLGYPTQKPLELLERIIQASSNAGDLVLDPFCGCGTTIAAAQKLGRRWVGIDITHLSIALMKYRLKDMFELAEKKDYAVKGEPEDLPSAHQLANDDRYQFQWWACSLVQARPLGSSDGGKTGKKGTDKGVDGVISFVESEGGKTQAQRVLVQVKSGKVKSGDVRDLRGTIEREGAAMGIFITLENATRDMQTEAASAGFYESPAWGRFPKLQLLTIADLINGIEPKLPPRSANVSVKRAQKVVKQESGDQQSFFED